MPHGELYPADPVYVKLELMIMALPHNAHFVIQNAYNVQINTKLLVKHVTLA
jgi:hypothetical protein